MLANKGYAAYANNKVMTASPAELTLMLYEGAIKFANIAIQAIEAKDIQKAHDNIMKVEHIIEDKAIMDWEYIDNLPKEIDGFKLFINPKEPVKIINGSYIIIDYCDFSKETDLKPALYTSSTSST